MDIEQHLVLGAARSGKTRYALSVATALAQSRDAQVVYVATAEPRDPEMQQRILRHRQERPSQWHTLETPRHLARALSDIPDDKVVVVDCLTLWLSNALLADFVDEAPLDALPTWSEECKELMQHLARARHSIIFVSNEVGAGIVPLAPVARRFQDEQGWLNQAVASVCERVTLVVAGIPWPIKSAAGRSCAPPADR